MNWRWMMCAVAIALLPTPHQGSHRIAIDGDFTEWAQVAPAVSDVGDNAGGQLDIGEVRAVSDGRTLFMHMTLARAVAIQSLAGSFVIVADTDDNSVTGESMHGLEGADVMVECGAQSSGIVVTRLLRPAGRTGGEAWTAVNFRFAPRHADREFEWRFDLPATARVRVKLVFSTGGRLVDETDVLSISVPAPAAPTLAPGAGDRDPLARPASADLRVAVWNVAGMGPWNAEGLGRILHALDADILLLDEIWTALEAPDIAARLPVGRSGSGAAARWSVQASRGSGQRNAVAARGPVVPLELKVPYPGEALKALFDNDASDRINAADSGVGASVSLVEIGGRRVLVAPVDLTCCGGPDSGNESLRLAEAEALNRAVRSAAARGVDGILIGGDFNLVGTRAPVDIARRALDAGGASLEIVEARKLDGVSKDTWRSTGGRFPPGRLDWLLHSAATLEVLSAFVFDTADLSPRWLEHHKLKSADSLASDHLPIVADFRWRSRR